MPPKQSRHTTLTNFDNIIDAKLNIDELIEAAKKKGKTKIRIKVDGKELEINVKENKDSIWKKLLKIGVGTAAVAGAGALAYYGYKNKDDLMKAVKDYYNTGKTKVKEMGDNIKDYANEKYENAKYYWNNPDEFIRDTPFLRNARDFYYNTHDRIFGFESWIKDDFDKLRRDIENKKPIDIEFLKRNINDLTDAACFNPGAEDGFDEFKYQQFKPIIEDTLKNAMKYEKYQSGAETAGMYDFDITKQDLLNNLDFLNKIWYDLVRPMR